MGQIITGQIYVVSGNRIWSEGGHRPSCGFLGQSITGQSLEKTK